MSDDHDDHEVHGFSVPMGSLSDLMSAANARHDRLHMEVESLKDAVFGFLDSLTIEQLLVLRRVLNADVESAQNNYFDGLVTGFLIIKHKVDADTGLTVEEALALQAPGPKAT